MTKTSWFFVLSAKISSETIAKKDKAAQAQAFLKLRGWLGQIRILLPRIKGTSFLAVAGFSREVLTHQHPFSGIYETVDSCSDARLGDVHQKLPVPQESWHWGLPRITLTSSLHHTCWQFAKSGECSCSFWFKDCQSVRTQRAEHSSPLRKTVKFLLLGMCSSVASWHQAGFSIFRERQRDRRQTFTRKTAWIHWMLLFFSSPETSSKNFWSLTEPDVSAAWRWVFQTVSFWAICHLLGVHQHFGDWQDSAEWLDMVLIIYMPTFL